MLWLYRGAGQQLWRRTLNERISFVIPVLNEGEHIGALLACLGETFPGAERIVVDGGSSDDTAVRVLQSGTQLLLAEQGRARQMNLGAKAASGDYLVFLHADSLPPENPRALTDVLAQQPEWGFAPVVLSGQGRLLRLIEWSMNRRARVTRVATGDQMLFVRNSVFAALDGYADIPLMEDVELCKRLRRLGPPAVLAEPVKTSSRRWEERGVLITMVQMWLLRLAYFCGVSPQRLWRFYYGT